MLDSSDDFRCTGEHTDTDSPEPVVIEVDDEGVRLVSTESNKAKNGQSGSGPSDGFGAPAVIGAGLPSRKTTDHG